MGTARVCRIDWRGYGTHFKGWVSWVGGGWRYKNLIFFTHTIHHGSNWPRTALTPPRHRTTLPPGLNLQMYNIQDGQGFSLPQAIRSMQIGKYNLMLMTKTKIMDEEYCHNYLGYDNVCSQAVGTADGGTQGGWACLWQIIRTDGVLNLHASTRWTRPATKSCLVDSGHRSLESTYPCPLLITFRILSRHWINYRERLPFS